MSFVPNTSAVYAAIEGLDVTANFALATFGGTEIMKVSFDAQHTGRKKTKEVLRENVHEHQDIIFDEDGDNDEER
jgi:hypothetical protein